MRSRRPSKRWTAPASCSGRPGSTRIDRHHAMLVKLLVALSLMAVCVAIHAGGLTAALRRLRLIAAAHGFWADTWLFVVVAAWMILLHLVEVSVWGGFYLWRGAIAD